MRMMAIVTGLAKIQSTAPASVVEPVCSSTSRQTNDGSSPHVSASSAGSTSPYSTAADPTVAGGIGRPVGSRPMATETGIEVQSDPPIGAGTYEPPQPIVAGTSIPMPPDAVGYRLKRKLLGPPLHSHELEEQRLGKPTALAVFASDNLSSSAYATEEILHVLVPAVGLAAFSLVMPITGALLVMLALLILSYRETIKAYPSAGGAYLVTRDNFGIVPAQVAGAALLVGYILTVSVSVSAGTAALISSFDALSPLRVPISLGFIAIVMYGNLRGVKESGRVFAVPTYFFMLNMGVLLVYGMVRYAAGDLAGDRAGGGGQRPHRATKGPGSSSAPAPTCSPKAFASGGAAVTGVEAISNGVPAFKEPAWRNARQTLVVMGSGLAVMFFGLSFLASKIEVIPFEDGTPTVLGPDRRGRLRHRHRSARCSPTCCRPPPC